MHAQFYVEPGWREGVTKEGRGGREREREFGKGMKDLGRIPV